MYLYLQRNLNKMANKNRMYLNIRDHILQTLLKTMSNIYCPESLQKEIMLHFNIILLNTPMKLQFWFGWVSIYLTKRHTSHYVSEIELSDNVTDTIYIRSGLFPTDLQLCGKANAIWRRQANVKSWSSKLRKVRKGFSPEKQIPKETDWSKSLS